MRIPFCDFCAKSGSLCSRCRELIDSGKNDNLDLTISRILLEALERVRGLDRIEFKKAYKEEDFLLILSNNDGVRVFRDNEELSRRISRDTGSKRVIVVDYKKDQKRKLEELVYPLRIAGLSKIWLPGNMMEFKVLLEGGELDEDCLRKLEKLAKRMEINARFQA
jgi:transcription antitermination factor NusA-like protein